MFAFGIHASGSALSERVQETIRQWQIGWTLSDCTKSGSNVGGLLKLTELSLCCFRERDMHRVGGAHEEHAHELNYLSRALLQIAEVTFCMVSAENIAKMKSMRHANPFFGAHFACLQSKALLNAAVSKPAYAVPPTPCSTQTDTWCTLSHPSWGQSQRDGPLLCFAGACACAAADACELSSYRCTHVQHNTRRAAGELNLSFITYTCTLQLLLPPSCENLMRQAVTRAR